MALSSWMRFLAVSSALAFLAGGATAQESAQSAAQRPLEPIPAVTPSQTPVAAGVPKWSEFPTPPTGVPTVAQIAQRVKAQAAAASQLNSEVRALVWDNEKPEPYAQAALSRINPAYTKPLDATLTRQEIEKLAADLRRRAVPPPVAD